MAGMIQVGSLNLSTVYALLVFAGMGKALGNFHGLYDVVNLSPVLHKCTQQ